MTNLDRTAAACLGHVLLDVTSGPPVLYGAADVVADPGEAAAWAAEINHDPPMTPWGPLQVVAAELRAVTR
ncbi:hypothetical protein [Promicromonospora iranensis]|uniref:Uncharacterized protein n=1 Tax=Promicromonospora iranensis TaxID=1105144 RepID=A0ABU2CWH6_9MICO|nr:hypothetical protein [Promicromonospora iranensis]MDR7385679.1 hypothetical protein [Promicromonospora iranensis]